ncbi:hypothetical protein GCM10028808_49930 [Spirosoma migulaei]
MELLKDQITALLDSKGDGSIAQTFYNHTAVNDGVTIDRLDGNRYLIKSESDGSYTLSANTPIHIDQNYHYRGSNISLDVLTDWMLV